MILHHIWKLWAYEGVLNGLSWQIISDWADPKGGGSSPPTLRVSSHGLHFEFVRKVPCHADRKKFAEGGCFRNMNIQLFLMPLCYTVILKTPKLVEEESTKAESTNKIEGLSATKPPAMPRGDITESEDVNCKTR